jgi:hypothetical protein
VSKTIEEIVATELYGHRLPPADWEFIAAIRKAAAAGVGYGAMQQYCEWEWNARHDGTGWGPLSYERERAELEPDAERYRWLRDQRRWLFNLPPTPGISLRWENYIAGGSEWIDKAIDEARDDPEVSP